MAFPLIEDSLQWRGINFAELYEWLTRQSTRKNLRLKVIMPGQPNSSIQISINGTTLYLHVDDWIVRSSEGIYYVIEDDE